MAKNNSPLNDGSWAREDADRAKKLYSEGHDSHAHALGVDEHDADFAKHWEHGESYSGDGKAKYSSSMHMWESASQIGKHMSSNLWGEAARELSDDPLERDLTGQRAAMPQKEHPTKPKEKPKGRPAPKDFPG